MANVKEFNKKRGITPNEPKKIPQGSGDQFIQEREKLKNRIGETGRLGTEIATKQLESQRSPQDDALIKALIPAQPIDLGSLTPEQQARDVVNPDGIVGKGAATAAGLTGAVSAAGVGAAIGTAIAPGIGTAIGGGIGGVVGFAGGFFTKIGASKRQDVKQAFAVYTASKSNMAFIINEVNRGRLTQIQAQDMWDEELANFYSAERNIHEEIKTDLNKFLSDGADEAAKIEAFRRRLPQLQFQLELALQAPNPNTSINLDDAPSFQE